MQLRIFCRKAIAALAMSASFGTATAASLDKLQGAWTMVGTECGDTFVRAGDNWQFKDRQSPLNTGVIVDDGTIRGAYATCQFGQARGGDGVFTVMLGCEGAIMFSDIAVHFRVIDDRLFERFDPDFPEASIRYQKCS
jgi:hypothetical protein